MCGYSTAINFSFVIRLCMVKKNSGDDLGLVFATDQHQPCLPRTNSMLGKF